MSFQVAMFYLFAAILLSSAAMVVTIRNPVKAVLFLVLAFVSAASLWILLEAEFLAIVLVLVYVGAVMVLFLFVVMMIDVNLAALKEGFVRYLPLGGIVALLMVVEMGLVVGPRRFGLARVPAPAAFGPHYDNTRVLGRLLYTVYVYPFELAAVILLVAIVAAIAPTMRRRPDTKYQDAARQVSVTARQRLRMIKMPAEPKIPSEPKA
ncbi:MAG: NADH-quinone oxidoreductase subunit J [Gammaproteobacteria bacterium]|nr:NADH-quinone oxidoreductase subunit J [Gammaproteobacteria bacterium]